MARQVTESGSAQERRLTMSYDEFLGWSGEDTHAEWVNGEVTVFMPPNTRHQRLNVFLINLLSLYVRLLRLGEILTAPFEMRLLNGRSSREPDLLFVAHEHRDRLDAQRLDGPADLVVELISSTSARRDREEKFAEYAEAGVPEYWLLDTRPRREGITFYQLAGQGRYREARPDAEGRYHAAVLPGFWLRPDWLWQEPLPDPLLLLATIAPDALRGALAAGERERGGA